ncbi:cell wall-binding repeat-containing protein [Herbiconiux sp. UC225_62]|uniref:cell wall-binding repeat-containing protein n=1 Tax=Herbiconiux sp. UC225_62 TaxID=3350168 RepID=UPI0036D34FEA
MVALSPIAAEAALPGAAETQLLSVSSTGAAGDAASSAPVISADGRFVAFSSNATNLTGVAGGVRQIYLRDLAAGVTTLVSTGASGAGNADSTMPSISDDGGVIAYSSAATNIVGAASTGIPQALVWTRATGVTTVASYSDALATANAAVSEITLAGDGRSVAFTTSATNLAAYDTRGFDQVYERDLAGRTTMLVSHDPSSPSLGSSEGAGAPSISGDGGFVAFSSRAALSGFPRTGTNQIFRWQRSSRAIDLLSQSTTGGPSGDGLDYAAYPSISHDGNAVAFTSNAHDLIADPTSGLQVYLRDAAKGITRLISAGVRDGKPAHGISQSAAISADGSSVAFLSTAPDLTPDGRAYGDVRQAYERDLASGVTSLVSRPSAGPPGGNDDSLLPSISGDGALVAFASFATNLVSGSPGDTQVYLRNTTESPGAVRIGGADRFAVSAAVSADTFDPGVPVVYIASGATFADALCGSAAAGAQRAPVLLVAKDTIPDVVARELRRLLPEKIIVLGGTNTIDPSVEIALSAYTPTVTRIAGADRFEVSVGVSSSVFGTSAPTPVALVASGAVFPDALSGSAAAGFAGAPVLLVGKNVLPPAVANELQRLAPAGIVVLGGTDTVDEAVVASLSAIAPTTRIAGADRFAVSANVSAATFPVGTRTVYVASGAVFPDALSGSAAAIRRVGPVLLVARDGVPEPVRAELARLKPTRIVVLGGPATISDSVLGEMQKYAVPPS